MSFRRVREPDYWTAGSGPGLRVGLFSQVRYRTMQCRWLALTSSGLWREGIEGLEKTVSDPPRLPLSLSTVTPKQRTKQMHQDTKSPPPATQTTTLPRSLQLWPGPGRIQTLEKLRLSSIPLPSGFPSHLPFSDILV